MWKKVVTSADSALREAMCFHETVIHVSGSLWISRSETADSASENFHEENWIPGTFLTFFQINE